MLALEIDEGLDGTAFYLYHDVDNGHDAQRMHHDVGATKDGNHALLPTIGNKMRDITQQYQGKDIAITHDHLEEKFGMEVGKDAVEHEQTGIEGGVAEEKPGETHEVEREKHTQPSAQTSAAIGRIAA